jgi:hypothetical protein
MVQRELDQVDDELSIVQHQRATGFGLDGAQRTAPSFRGDLRPGSLRRGLTSLSQLTCHAAAQIIPAHL